MLNNSNFMELCLESGIPYQKRSIFYTLKPIGINSFYMECLSSYIIRLAEAHSSKVRDIVRYALKTRGILKGVQDPSIKRLNGMGQNVANVIEGLEELTSRNDLRILGTLNWKGFVKSIEIFKDHKEWCPTCFYEWKRLGFILYEPLIWQFNDIRFCYKHHTQLISKCSKCKNTLEVCCDYESIGYCSKCYAFLGKNNVKENHKITESEFETANYIAESIINAGNIADLKPNPLIQAMPINDLRLRGQRKNTVAFKLFQESSSDFKFF